MDITAMKMTVTMPRLTMVLVPLVTQGLSADSGVRA